MTTYKLVIAPAAQTDLKSIYQYGLKQWGQKQSHHYIERVKERIWKLTEQPLMGIDRSELLPAIRSLPIESHTLFYRVKANNIEIIRILHGRQDPLRNLK